MENQEKNKQLKKTTFKDSFDNDENQDSKDQIAFLNMYLHFFINPFAEKIRKKLKSGGVLVEEENTFLTYLTLKTEKIKNILQNMHECYVDSIIKGAENPSFYDCLEREDVLKRFLKQFVILGDDPSLTESEVNLIFGHSGETGILTAYRESKALNRDFVISESDIGKLKLICYKLKLAMDWRGVLI